MPDITTAPSPGEVRIFRHVCTDGRNENCLWAWSIAIEDKMEVRKNYDYGIPRITSDDGIPEIKYPQLDPGWWSCRGVVRDVDAAYDGGLGDFADLTNARIPRKLIRMGFFPRTMNHGV